MVADYWLWCGAIPQRELMQSTLDASEDLPTSGHRLVPVKVPVQGSIIEMMLLAALLSSAALSLPIMGPVRQLAALSVLGLFILHFGNLRPYVQHFWFLFLFPAWIALSILWSPVPQRTLGFAIPHVFEVCALIYFASRLSPDQIIKSIFWSGLVLFLFAAPHIGMIGPHSIPPGFAQKNWLANAMFVAMVSSLYMVFAPKSNIAEKLVALAVIPISILIIIKAESATALVLSLFSLFFMVMVGLFWRMIASVKMLPTLFIAGIVALSLLALMLGIMFLQESPLDMFLGVLGKDTSLTGRTELWDYALELIKQKPVFGIGAEGFWLPNRGDAQSLLEFFYKGVNVRFSFHNSYLETSVQVGLVGLFFLLIAEIFVISRIILNWFKMQDITAAFFLMFGLLVLIRSFTESELYNPLNTNKMVMFLGGLTFLAYRRGYAPEAVVQAHLDRQKAGAG